MESLDNEAGCPSIRVKALSSERFPVGVVSTVCVPEKVEDQHSGNLTLNHSAVELVPPTIDSA